MFPNLPVQPIVYGLWGIYAILSIVYLIAYTRWTVKCGKWYSQMTGVVAATALRVTKTVGRSARFLNVWFYLVMSALGIALFINVLAVENQYLIQVLILIAAPWLIRVLLRGFIARQADKRDIETATLLPRRMAATASIRQEGYDSGAFKRE